MLLTCLPKNHSDEEEAEIHVRSNFGDSFSELLLGDRASSALQVVKSKQIRLLCLPL